MNSWTRLSIRLVFSLVVYMSLAAADPFSFTPVYRVDLVDVSVSPFDLTCQEKPTAFVTVHNTGSVDATVYAELMHDALGVHGISENILVPVGQQQTVLVPFTLEKETQGPYLFSLWLHTEKEITQSFHTFVFRGCKKDTITSLILQSNDLAEELLRYQQPAIEEEVSPAPALPLPLRLSVFLMGIIALLVVVFLVITLWRERTF